MYEKNINNFCHIPLKTTITKKQNTDIYTIHIQKYGTKHYGMSIELTEEQVNRLKWWY